MCKLPDTTTYALYFFLKLGIFKNAFERIMNHTLKDIPVPDDFIYRFLHMVLKNVVL